MKFLAFAVLAFAFALGEVYVVGRAATTSGITTPCGSGDCLAALLHDNDGGLKPVSVTGTCADGRALGCKKQD
jgi:hypothetical protein